VVSSTLTRRNLSPDDAAAVAAVYAAMESEEPTDEAFSEQDMLEELTGPGVDLARGSIAMLSDGQLIAFGFLQVSGPADEWKAVQSGGVLPANAGRGIGRHLVRELERKAVALRDADAPGRPGQLKIWVDEERRRTAALVAKAGYQTWRHFFRMRCDLTAPIASVAAPTGVQIRRYRHGDDEAVRVVSNSSFADHWGSTPMDVERWRASFAEATSFRPEHSWVALVDNEVTSFVLSFEFEAETVQRGYPTGYVARVGTAQQWRGRGIAGALLSTTLAAMAAAGHRYAELGVDAASPTGAGRIYERAGFSTYASSRVVGKHF
jgi:mycothiol synthase